MKAVRNIAFVSYKKEYYLIFCLQYLIPLSMSVEIVTVLVLVQMYNSVKSMIWLYGKNMTNGLIASLKNVVQQLKTTDHKPKNPILRVSFNPSVSIKITDKTLPTLFASLYFLFLGTSEDEKCLAVIFIPRNSNLSEFYQHKNLRLKGINLETLSTISPEDLEGKVIDTSCEDRHNFVCKFKIEINQNNGIGTSSFGFRDTRLHSGRFLKHEASQIRICPREKPNAINIDGITMCCKLDKDCAEQTLQGDLRKCCDQFPNTDSDQECLNSHCVDCKNIFIISNPIFNLNSN